MITVAKTEPTSYIDPAIEPIIFKLHGIMEDDIFRYSAGIEHACHPTILISSTFF